MRKSWSRSRADRQKQSNKNTKSISLIDKIRSMIESAMISMMTVINTNRIHKFTNQMIWLNGH